MFSTTSIEASDRISQVAAMVRAIEDAELRSGMAVSSITRAAKGLVFVVLYAAYEYCVHQAFRATVLALNAHSVPHRQLAPGALALALDSECSTLRDKVVERAWEDRLSLFQKSRDASPATIRDSVFPADGSHMRAGQLRTLQVLFGVPNPLLPHPRMATRINELVEHRNAIAHGRERAEDVGGRYTVDELKERVKDAGELLQHVITTLETHSADRVNFC